MSEFKTKREAELQAQYHEALARAFAARSERYTLCHMKRPAAKAKGDSTRNSKAAARIRDLLPTLPEGK